MSDKTKQALEHFSKVQKSLENKISKFKDEFQKNPQHALAWADRTFYDVSMLEQVERVVYCLTPNERSQVCSVSEVEASLMESLLNHNSCFSHSTSQCTNLLASCKGRAITEVLKQVKYFK
jgi:hypothetical protein